MSIYDPQDIRDPIDVGEYHNVTMARLFLRRLLEHKAVSETEIMQECSFYGLEFLSDKFVVVHFEIDGDTTMGKEKATFHAQFMIENAFDSMLQGQSIFSLPDNDSITFIVNWQGPGELAVPRLSQVAESLVKQFDEEFFLPLTAAISQLWGSGKDLALAWDDIRELERYYEFIQGSTRVLVYDSVCRVEGSGDGLNAIEAESRLLNCLRNRDLVKARGLTQDIFIGALTQGNTRMIGMRVTGLMSHYMDFIDSELCGLEGEKKGQLMRSLGAQTTLSGFMEVVDELIAELDNAESQDSGPKWLKRVAPYIETNYTDHNLCVESVAQALDLNVRYMSSVFTRIYGYTVLDHIHQTRIRVAVQLLEAGVSVKDAAEAVGYNSLTTMYRAFKKYRGITPASINQV